MSLQKKNINEVIRLLSKKRVHGTLRQKYLSEKVEVLKEIIHSMDAIIFIYNLKSKQRVWTNGNFAKTLGYGDEDLLLTEAEVSPGILHPDDVGKKHEVIDLLLSGNEQYYSRVLRALHKEGHWVWLLVTTNVIMKDEVGSPTHALGMAIDLTQQIQADGQLSKMICENHRMVNHSRIKMLTPKEKEIISHIASGLSCKKISIRMGITYYTVETHIRNIHHKLDLHNTSALINFAIENGLHTQSL